MISRLAVLAAMGLALAGPALAQKTVTVVRTIDVDNYDPARSTARSASEVLFMAGDTLVALDYDMKTVKPLLAKSWEVSADGKTYTFKLRDDVTFCSGKKFTARDAAATIERWLDPETKGLVTWRAGPVEKLTAVDDTTLEYRLKQPFSELLYQMTQHFHTIVNAEQAKALGRDFGVKGLDATGPFCWESWTPRDQTVLTRNPNYKWGPALAGTSPSPQVDKIVWKIVPEEGTRVASIRTGQSDLTQYIPYSELQSFIDDKRFSSSKAEAYFWTYFIGFKIDKESVSDTKVRLALNAATDVKGITEGLTFGFATPAESLLAPQVLDYNDKVDTKIYSYDPARAAALLDEAGWKLGPDRFRYKDGKKLAPVAYGFNDPTWRQIFEAVQGDLRKVGVDLQLQLFDATVAWGKLATQEFDAFGMSFPYVSSGDALNLYFRSTNAPTPNRMNWKDPETDTLLNTGSAALTDAVRASSFGAVQKKVHDAAVWIPIYHEPLYVIAGPRVNPVKAHGIYGSGLYKGLGIALK